MRCPSCGQDVVVTESVSVCKCTRVPHTIAGRPLSSAEIAQLILNRATTEVLTGFMSRAGNVFDARLVIKDGRVVFVYPESRRKNMPPDTAWIRAEAYHSGAAVFVISGPIKKHAQLSFGLISAREAECLVLITAVKYLQWACRDYNKMNVTVSLNNRDLAAYILRERRPRDSRVKQAVLYLLSLLSKFAGWRVVHEPKKRPRLRGDSSVQKFPAGVFPWLQIHITQKNHHVEVRLPDDPAVIAQFRSSLRRATGRDGLYRLPLAAERAVKAWAARVKAVDSV